MRAAFTPRAVGALEQQIQATVDRAIASFDGDDVELFSAFARPIPALVIAEMLGAAPEDQARLLEWSDDLGAIVFSRAPGRVDEAPLLRATGSFVEFFTRPIERERRSPSGNLLCALVHSDVGELSTLELVGACTLLLFGGHETTTNLIDNALAILLERPELAERLRAEPELWERAIDEFMRVIGPARTMARKVAIAHTRGGQLLDVGDTVLLSIAAANHDEAVFASPDTLDLARAPNPHLGFGWGPHFCLGANLARLEARVALRTLLERFPRMRPAAPFAPPSGGTMGFAHRILQTRLHP